MSYNLDAIKAKINQLSGNRASSGSKTTEKTKVNWWKPQLGQHDIRFLPYQDRNGQPFHEVSYYDSRLLSERRFVAGCQFEGTTDPVFNLLTELKKDKSKEAWTLWRNLQPKERYYAPIIVRGEEDKGVQLWELNSKLVKDIYSVLAHPDYKDENLMDPENGYDFTVTVSPTDKTFAGNPVKDIKLQPRRKPSPLAKSADVSEKIVAAIPNLEAYFKAQTKSEDELNAILQNFLAGNGSSSEVSSEEVEEAKDKTVSAAKAKKAKNSIDAAFDDL